jgi:hypothetical protein
MSTVKTQKRGSGPASVKRAQGRTSKTAATNRDLFGDDGNAGAGQSARRARAEPASKRASTSEAATVGDSAGAQRRTANVVGSVRINFDLEKPVHKRLKMLAVEADMTIADWMRALIQKELQKGGK